VLLSHFAEHQNQAGKLDRATFLQCLGTGERRRPAAGGGRALVHATRWLRPGAPRPPPAWAAAAGRLRGSVPVAAMPGREDPHPAAPATPHLQPSPPATSRCWSTSSSAWTPTARAAWTSSSSCEWAIGSSSCLFAQQLWLDQQLGSGELQQAWALGGAACCCARVAANRWRRRAELPGGATPAALLLPTQHAHAPAQPPTPPRRRSCALSTVFRGDKDDVLPFWFAMYDRWAALGSVVSNWALGRAGLWARGDRWKHDWAGLWAGLGSGLGWALGWAGGGRWKETPMGRAAGARASAGCRQAAACLSSQLLLPPAPLHQHAPTPAPARAGTTTAT
jgi:hypothetical protein